MPLEMKYFILKPRSKRKNDIWASASRAAMREFAKVIETTDPELARALLEWVDFEFRREKTLEGE